MKTMSPLAVKAVPLHLLILKNVPIFDQLQLEEALLRADERNWCMINIGSPSAIVMGISGKPELLVNQEKMREHPVPLIRRFSGGGTVFIDENTYFLTWICNTECSGVNCCPSKVHEWGEMFYQSALPSLGLKLRENDYVIEDRKFGGNAQYFRKQRWLHHTSLLWDYNEQNMDYLLMPRKMPDYRQKRSHRDFLCGLCDFLPSQETFKRHILDALDRHFEVRGMKYVDVIPLLAKEHRKATQLIGSG